MSSKVEPGICVYCDQPARAGDIICDKCIEEGEKMLADLPQRKKAKRRFLPTDFFAKAVIGQKVMDDSGNMWIAKNGHESNREILFTVIADGHRDTIRYETCKKWRARFLAREKAGQIKKEG